MRRRLREFFNDLKYQTIGLPRFKVRTGDCFVTSFPRSGNTWMRYMLFHALYGDHQWDLTQIERRMPIVDRPDIRRSIKAMGDQPFRLFKSHEPFRHYFLTGKTAYLVRDGRDALVSYYHYRLHMNQTRRTMSQWVRRSIRGRFRYGPWHDHVAGWLAHQEHPSVIVVRYEQMVDEPARQLKRVLDHFGLPVSDEQIERAAAEVTIDHVNRGFERWASDQARQYNGGLGGGSGKGRDQLAAEDHVFFMRRAGEVMERLGYGGGRSDEGVAGSGRQ